MSKNDEYLKPIFSELLSPFQTSQALGVTEETLAVWRCTKRYNLPYVKVGRLVRYQHEDIKNFIKSRTCSYQEVTRG